MVKNIPILVIIAVATVTVNAETLFYTDFKTTPEGFKAASDAATANGKEDTLVMNEPGATAVKDTIIDGCTLTANKSSTSTTVIVISKPSQSFIPLGDTAGCTSGRLSLKNSGNSIKFPSVNGPCMFIYYGAASSATAGRGFQCIVNGISTPEAGITELLLDDSLQATKKVSYAYTETGPVEFTLIALGGVYLYDVTITSDGVSHVISNHTAPSPKSIWTKDNMMINSKNSSIDFYSLSGIKVMHSAASFINLTTFPRGLYLARIAGTSEKIKILR